MNDKPNAARAKRAAIAAALALALASRVAAQATAADFEEGRRLLVGAGFDPGRIETYPISPPALSPAQREACEKAYDLTKRTAAEPELSLIKGQSSLCYALAAVALDRGNAVFEVEGELLRDSQSLDRGALLLMIACARIGNEAKLDEIYSRATPRVAVMAKKLVLTESQKEAIELELGIADARRRAYREFEAMGYLDLGTLLLARAGIDLAGIGRLAWKPLEESPAAYAAAGRAMSEFAMARELKRDLESAILYVDIGEAVCQLVFGSEDGAERALDGIRSDLASRPAARFARAVVAYESGRLGAAKAILDELAAAGAAVDPAFRGLVESR